MEKYIPDENHPRSKSESLEKPVCAIFKAILISVPCILGIIGNLFSNLLFYSNKVTTLLL